MSEQGNEAKILVVDDEPQVITAIEHLLEDTFEVTGCADAESALKTLETEGDTVAVILSDQRMPGMYGDEFLSRAKTVSDAPRLLITAYPDIDVLARAINSSQIFAYIEKPWNPIELRQTILNAAQHYNTKTKDTDLNVAETSQPAIPETPKSFDDLLDLAPVRVIVSSNRLEAHIETIFPDTTYEQIQNVLIQEGICWGIQEDTLQKSLEKAHETHQEQKHILAAKGSSAIYRKRKNQHLAFLEKIKTQKDEPIPHLTSNALTEIAQVMTHFDLKKINAFEEQVIAATPEEVLVSVKGQDKIRAGRDILGQEIQTPLEKDEHPMPLKPGTGVYAQPNGSLVARHFGYVSVVEDAISVISPIWTSPDKMATYYINMPQFAPVQAPQAKTLLKMLADLGLHTSIDRKLIVHICQKISDRTLTERCIKIVSGRHPRLSEGQVGIVSEVVDSDVFENLQKAFGASDIPDVTTVQSAIRAVHAGTMLSEQAKAGDSAGPGWNIFGQQMPPLTPIKTNEPITPGAHVRPEEIDGRMCYVSEIYGYAGLNGNCLSVMSPIWVNPDHLNAHFITLPQNDTLPTTAELEALLELKNITHGVDQKALSQICQKLPTTKSVLVAQGTPAISGENGHINTFFTPMPAPAQFLETGKKHFLKRDQVPKVKRGHLIAQRLPPQSGVPGIDIMDNKIEAKAGKETPLRSGTNILEYEENR